MQQNLHKALMITRVIIYDVASDSINTLKFDTNDGSY